MSKVMIRTKAGHELLMDDAADRVELRHSTGSVIAIDASGTITITGNARVELMASSVEVHAASATFDGTVQCETLVATNGVVSPSYTPGTGNVW